MPRTHPKWRQHTARSARAVVLAVVLAVGAHACTSRTIPLPPPSVDQISTPDANGFVTVTGLGLEEATLAVLNEDTEEGVLVPTAGDGCGSACPFEAVLKASEDDSLRVWQFVGTENPIWFEVP